MKKQRKICSVILCLAVVLMIGLTAEALTSGYVQAGSNLNITLNGNVTFVKGMGVALFPDKVTYHAAISGSDTYMVTTAASDVRVYVTPGTNSKTLGSKFIYYPTNVVSGTNVPCGTEGSYATMELFCVGNTTTINDY